MLAALTFVIALMGGLSIVLKKIGMPGTPNTPKNSRAHQDYQIGGVGCATTARGTYTVRFQAASCHSRRERRKLLVKTDIEPVVIDEKAVYKFFPVFWADDAWCMSALPTRNRFNLDLGAGDAGGGHVTGRVVQLLIMLTVLSLAPSILIADDMFHADYRHAVVPAHRDRHSANAAEYGDDFAGAVFDVLYHVADIGGLRIKPPLCR